jgi:hypothetical protein
MMEGVRREWKARDDKITSSNDEFGEVIKAYDYE